MYLDQLAPEASRTLQHKWRDGADFKHDHAKGMNIARDALVQPEESMFQTLHYCEKSIVMSASKLLASGNPSEVRDAIIYQQYAPVAFTQYCAANGLSMLSSEPEAVSSEIEPQNAEDEEEAEEMLHAEKDDNGAFSPQTVDASLVNCREMEMSEEVTPASSRDVDAEGILDDMQTS